VRSLDDARKKAENAWIRAADCSGCAEGAGDADTRECFPRLQAAWIKIANHTKSCRSVQPWTAYLLHSQHPSIAGQGRANLMSGPTVGTPRANGGMGGSITDFLMIGSEPALVPW
jgi:hypothetical protein